MNYGVLLFRTDVETGETVKIEKIEFRGLAEAGKAFEIARAFANSLECNHDQTDRSE